MPALMAIIGGDANPLKRELAAVERLAKQSGVSLQRGLAGGMGEFHGSSGIIREALTIIREASAGNWHKVPGSVSILAQRMGILKYIIKDTASAANVLADAWQKEAERTAIAAIASTRKAAASMAALYAEGGETEANLAEAASAEAKAAADVMAAKAAQAKAVASGEAAAAATAEAGAGKVSLGILGKLGIVTAIVAAGVYGLYKAYSYAKEKATGLELPVKHLDAIIKRTNQAAEGQKQINREVEKTVELYNSAAKAAERHAEVTKSHYDHLRKMTEYAEERDLKAAKTEKDKEAVRVFYANERLRISQEQMTQEIAAKNVEQVNLSAEAARKKREADAIEVMSKQREEELAKQKRAKAEAGQKYLEEVESGKAGKSAAKLADARQWIQDAKDFGLVMANNEELRKHKEELTKAAADSAGKATQAGLEASTLKQQMPEKLQQQIDEEQAHLDAQAGDQKQKVLHGHLTALQQLGGYIAPGNAVLVDVNKSMLHELKKINSKLDQPGRHFGRVKF